MHDHIELQIFINNSDDYSGLDLRSREIRIHISFLLALCRMELLRFVKELTCARRTSKIATLIRLSFFMIKRISYKREFIIPIVGGFLFSFCPHIISHC